MMPHYLWDHCQKCWVAMPKTSDLCQTCDTYVVGTRLWFPVELRYDHFRAYTRINQRRRCFHDSCGTSQQSWFSNFSCLNLVQTDSQSSGVFLFALPFWVLVIESAEPVNVFAEKELPSTAWINLLPSKSWQCNTDKPVRDIHKILSAAPIPFILTTERESGQIK